jgi:hypothetical protein
MAAIVMLLVLGIGMVTVMSSRTYYSSKHPLLDRIRESFSKIDPKYAKIPLQIGGSAYTENKEVITLCLKDPYTSHYYDFNTLIYVSLHELSHVITPPKYEEHGEEFKKNFSKLLNIAAAKGIYDPKKAIPMTYCGVGTA